LTIAFRVDVSPQIGTGHIMRCLTLAKVLRDLGKECLFVSRSHQGNLNELPRSQGFATSELPFPEGTQQTSNQPLLAHAHWLGVSWRTDARQTIEALGNTAVDWLIVDHYALDKRWESQLRHYTKKIMVIDDLADREHDCDLLLDQNLVTDYEIRYERLVVPSCTLLLGPKYALLQPEYAELHSRTPPRSGPVRRIFVYFGGSDLQNLTGFTISVFLNLKLHDLQLDVVINSKSPNAKGIRAQVVGHTNITLYENLPSLAPLMAKADLAIGASGATTWERCCLGLHAIVITVAENQIAIADSLQRAGLIRWVSTAKRVNAEILRDAIEQEINSTEIASSSKLCSTLVDGGGANRVASAITLRSDSGLTARAAEAADEKLLLNWANDPMVRENSFERLWISDEIHHEWFVSRLKADSSVRIYIIETESRLPVGQVRFELDDLGWEINFSIADFARSLGLGTRLLNVAIREFRIAVPHAPLVGRVKASNNASAGVFRRLGFKQTQRSNYLIFTCAPPQPVCN